MWQLILLLSILIVSLIFYQNFSTVGIEGLDNRKDDKEEHKVAAAAVHTEVKGAAAKPAQAAVAPAQTGAAKPAQAAVGPAQTGAAGHPQTGTGHPQTGHAQAGHPQTGHAQAGHPQTGTGHPQAGHAQAGHPQAGHPQAGHAQAGHAHTGETGHPHTGETGHPHTGTAAQHGVNRDSKPAEGHHGEHMEKKHDPSGHSHAATAALGTGAAVGTAASASGAGTSTSNMNKYDSNTIYSPPPSWINKNSDTQGSTYASNTATSHSAYAQLPPIQQNAFNQTYVQSICPQSTIETFAASLTIFKNAINTFIQCLERTNNPHYDTLIQKLKGIQTSMNDL